MFSLLQARLDILEIRSMLVLPTTMLTEPNQKRWHMAFAVIYCSRAFSTTPLKNPRKKSSVSSNRVVINVFEPHPCFPKIDQSVLAGIVKQKNLDQLWKYDGVEGLACSLETNLEKGISGDVEDVSRRSEAFGSNTYRRPPVKSLLYFVWEALRDPTILILLICAALSTTRKCTIGDKTCQRKAFFVGKSILFPMKIHRRWQIIGRAITFANKRY